jgi:tripartite-type tricarboxylate transporter receptor subunit TctC
MLRKFIVAAVLACSLSAQAAERITFMVAWSAASGLAANTRALCTEMNRIQNKYEFVPEFRPGAGGAIGSNYVLQNPKNTITVGSSTFFLRSNFDRATGYDADSFQGVFVQVIGTPVALYSSKYSTLDEYKKSNRVSTGISGYGSHSNLLSTILASTGTTVDIINYPSLVDATKDVLGKHLDSSWNWLYDIEPQADAGKIKVLAITGSKTINGYPTFASLGVKGFENVSASYAVFASAEMPEERTREIYEILKQAHRDSEFQTSLRKQYYASTPDMTFAETQAWYRQQVRFWREQSAKVKPLQ